MAKETRYERMVKALGRPDSDWSRDIHYSDKGFATDVSLPNDRPHLAAPPVFALFQPAPDDHGFIVSGVDGSFYISREVLAEMADTIALPELQLAHDACLSDQLFKDGKAVSARLTLSNAVAQYEAASHDRPRHICDCPGGEPCSPSREDSPERVVIPTTRRAVDIGLNPEEYDEATRLGALRVLAGWTNREFARRAWEEKKELEAENERGHDDE